MKTRPETFYSRIAEHRLQSRAAKFLYQPIDRRPFGIAMIEFGVRSTTVSDGELNSSGSLRPGPFRREIRIMLMYRKQMWALAAAMSIAGVGHAGDSPGQPAAAVQLANLTEDDLPPAPLPEPQGKTANPPAAVPPSVPPPVSSTAPAGSQPPPMMTGPGMLAPGMIGSHIAGINRWGVTPPPGTLGRTYLRRSTLVPDEDHPRKGVVVVKLPEEADVSGRGLKVKWTGEEWRLETAQPLVPGVPHIYAIRAEWDTPTGRVEQTRWVRLIMGRVVDLEF